MIVYRACEGGFFPVRFDEPHSKSGDRYSRSRMIVLSRGSRDLFQITTEGLRGSRPLTTVRPTDNNAPAHAFRLFAWDLRKPAHMPVSKFCSGATLTIL